MSPSAQIRLLRVLQENTVVPLGSNQQHQVDARILSATNVDMRTLLRSGRFREDLFYRLRVLDAAVPPLRARKEDLPLLVGHFLRRHGSLAPADEPARISPCAWALLREYPFPGNVRELEHAIQHALVLSRGGTIDLQHLPDEIRGPSGSWPSDDKPLPLAEAMKHFEREVIAGALERTGGNRTQAADLLGITRKSLWEKVKRHAIRVPSTPKSRH
jgi:DNA-binding NtrC family response regulator